MKEAKDSLKKNYLKEDDTKMSIKNKVVLVTGGSSGIGAATVDLLAENGATVIAAARRTNKLETLVSTLLQKGYHADYKQLDVTDFEQMQHTVQEIIEAYGKIDVIVNNAGVMPLSKLESLKIAEWNRMIDVNIRGVLHGIGAVLPVMKEQNSGHIVNIASIGAYEVTPTAAVYCATKYAVRAITEGLRQEATNNIRATVIAPGVTVSELADHITDKQASEAMIEYRRQALPASAIAHAILYAISQPLEIDVSELIVRPTLSL
ncbi:SDR family oxidoreductase [Bacillus mojavensis]|uniref:SDR family oxidoreductase n=1 Tax=Bacillus subtilis group TaxID=653685 RepID=UPI0006A80197|nr:MULTISPECIES: SDR family oxidoreductase [Bacillus subtilis group]CUB18626.1 putative oxidoreductase [Bacillus cereus]MCY8480168.1 SDR family oxidoreductase [Bacillus mojavensis]MCY9091009.1 SDR family oxidoreductase [Bacillus mojavensis]MEC1423546.1 SDR family oxidoreductase [Bacillus subtilis]MEC1528500.1 SDR family oxidoreductase [Bacillus spizizenii]